MPKTKKPKEFSVIYGDKRHIESNEPGVCPVCGNTFIEYGDVVSDDQKVWYPAQCDKGHLFEEWYDLTFVESVERGGQ
jgi:RNA polymerase subunit RPABC4/transcription elongation factor Spt4